WQLKRLFEDDARFGASQRSALRPGQEHARRVNKHRGDERRKAVIAYAQRAYADDPRLREKDSETARRIARMAPPELRKSNGCLIAKATIYRYLREARDKGFL
ncbi:MAG: hypothetical protein AAFS03_00895, partial [Pseudomonadota bacterium]